MKVQRFTLYRIFVLSVLLTVANPMTAEEKIEGQLKGQLICSVEANKFIAMFDGRIAADGPLEIVNDNQMLIKYFLTPIRELENHWMFLLRLEGHEFARVETIPISKYTVLEPTKLQMKNRELIVRESLNDQSRFNLSQDFIQLIGKNHAFTLHRYYKNDWQGFSTIFMSSDNSTLQHTFAFDCRNKTDRLDEILNVISLIYEN